MTPHELYLCKKEVAKLLMRDKGCTFEQAFALVPDEAITSHNPQQVYSELYRAEIAKSTAKAKK